jgi:hypothetical protein
MTTRILSTLILVFSLSALPAQTSPENKLYKALVGTTCKDMIDGGCMLYSYRLLDFSKDSVRVTYDVTATCTSKEREKGYKHIYDNLNKTYKWHLSDQFIVIEGFDEYGTFRLLDSTLIAEKTNITFKEQKKPQDVVLRTNELVKAMHAEKLKKIKLKKLGLSFDTIFIATSPVTKYSNIDTSRAEVLVYYKENEIRKIEIGPTAYYFHNSELIQTSFMCTSGAHMGLCGGLFSSYKNYFSGSQLVMTTEGFESSVSPFRGGCPCADNIIADEKTISKIKNEFLKSTK